MDFTIPPEVQSGLWGLLVLALTWAGLKFKGAITALQKDVGETKQEVKNDHGTNLRDDIDKVLLGLDKAVIAIDFLKEAQESSRDDRKVLHDDVRELKVMYREALDEHKEMWEAIRRSESE